MEEDDDDVSARIISNDVEYEYVSLASSEEEEMRHLVGP